MTKTLISFLLIGQLFSFTLFPSHSIAAAQTDTIKYRWMEMSRFAKYMTQRPERPRVYSIPLHHVKEAFGKSYCSLFNGKYAKMFSRKGEKKGVRFLLKVARKVLYNRFKHTETANMYLLFNSFQTDCPYTYVLLDNELIFTESSSLEQNSNPSQNLFSKHLLLSNRKTKVRMAGEMWFYHHPSKRKVYVVIDNASGTYVPTPQRAQTVVQLLKQELNPSEEVEFIFKTYSQEFDPMTQTLQEKKKEEKAG